MIDAAERHPVTTVLVVGSIAAVLASETGRSVDHLVLTPLTAFTEPWRFFTTILPHGGILHLFFNVFMTVRIGSQIEARLGTWRMIALTLITSVFAAGCELLFFNSGIGLSGAVFAFVFYAYSRARHDPRFQGVVTRQDLNFFIVWFVFCIIATQTGFMRIANAAHGGGALIGFLLGMRNPWLAPVAVTSLAVALPLVVSPDRSPELWYMRRQATDFLQDGDPVGAIRIYEDIFDLGVRRPADRYNYGVALHRAGRREEGDAVLVEVAATDPSVAPNPHDRALLMQLLENSRALEELDSADNGNEGDAE